MMEIVRIPTKAHAFIQEQKKAGKTIGLVPTMGALHQGHAYLIEKCKRENDFTVCSIYVNPAQFNNQKDFDTYPDLFEQDIAMVKALGCNAVFAPSHQAMYPEGAGENLLQFNFGKLASELEGRYRPGHFSGVGVVVAKLLNIIAPHKAYFGQKDLQQYLIIKKLCRDLSFQTEIVMCPTKREEDGLAMSSRNLRLTKTEREKAPLLYSVLSEAVLELKSGKKASQVKQKAFDEIAKEPMFKPEYVEVVSLESFEILSGQLTENAAICVSAHLGNARLIDNLLVQV